MVGLFVVFEASFAKVECRKSTHAEGTFFAVVAGPHATQKLEYTIDAQEQNDEECNSPGDIDKQYSQGVEDNPDS